MTASAARHAKTPRASGRHRRKAGPTSAPVLRRAGSATVLGGMSQGLGLVQYVILLAGGGGGRASDAFVYMSALGMLPTQIVTVGVLLPMLMRGTHLSVGRWRVLTACLGLSSGALAMAGAAYFAVGGGDSDGIAAIAAVVAVNSVAQSFIWLRGVVVAAAGRASVLSAATLASSVAACVSLLAVLGSGSTTSVLAMAVGVTVGSVATAIVVAPRTGVRDQLPEIDGARAVPRGDVAWFGVKAASGYGAGIALQTVASTLPPSSLTALAVLAKVVAGLSTIVTNSVLPVLVNRTSSDGRAATRYAFAVSSIGAVMTGATIVLWRVGIVPGAAGHWVLIGIAWTIAGAVSATVQRVAERFHAASVSVMSVATSVLIPVATIVLAATGGITLSQVLVAYVALELFVALGVALSIRLWSTAVFAGAVVVVAVGLSAVLS